MTAKKKAAAAAKRRNGKFVEWRGRLSLCHFDKTMRKLSALPDGRRNEWLVIVYPIMGKTGEMSEKRVAPQLAP